MGRVARGPKSRWTRAAGRAIALACAAVALSLPAGAVADPPAQGQYTPPNVSASGSAQDRGNANGAVPAASSSGSGDATLPILLGAVVVIGGVGALILYRRSRSEPGAPE